MKERIIKTILCTAISFFVWFCLSKTFASTDTMSTTFQNISKESWLMITDYLYDNIEDVTVKSKIQPITSNGDYATQMYTTLKTYLQNVTISNNDTTMIRKYKYAHSDLSRLTFIVYSNNIYIYSNEIWQRKSGTSDYTLDSYEVVDTASYTFSNNVFKFYDDASNNTFYANNRDYIYINLNNYTIANGSGNYSNLGANLTMSRYTVTQNDDLTLWSYGSNSDTTMIVQFAGSGTNGNPVISYFLKDYLSSSSTVYPMLLKNAVYLDGSANTGGSTGGNTGTDTGGNTGGGNTGSGNVDLGNIEQGITNINNNLNNINTNIQEGNNTTQEIEDFLKEDINSEENTEEFENIVNDLQSSLENTLENNSVFGALTVAEQGFFDIITGSPEDFKIEWNDVLFYDVVLIPAGEVNFSQMCREIDVLSTVKLTVNIILSAFLSWALIKHIYNLVLATLGIDNTYLYETEPSVSISSTKKAGTATQTTTYKVRK